MPPKVAAERATQVKLGGGTEWRACDDMGLVFALKACGAKNFAGVSELLSNNRSIITRRMAIDRVRGLSKKLMKTGIKKDDWIRMINCD